MIYFFRRRGPSLREVLSALTEAAFQTVREVRHVSTKVDDVIARLKAVQATQDKTIGEVSAAKDEITALTAEVAALRAIIDNAGDTIPAEKLAELDAAVSAVEDRAGRIDAALPDLPVAGTSPAEGGDTGTGADPGTGTDTGTDPAPATDANVAPAATPFK
jgi:hypothetical protein